MTGIKAGGDLRETQKGALSNSVEDWGNGEDAVVVEKRTMVAN